MDPLATWTLLVVVFFACFATQQPALRQMGLTAETLFSGWIGSMKNEFVASQCRRTLAVAWCHAGLAAGYGLGVLYLVFVLVPEHGNAQEWSHEWRSVVVAAAVAIIVAAGGVAGYLYYVSKDLRRHWIFRRVAAQDPANPVRLINAIDAEVRSNFDDLSPVGSQVLFITISWILKSTTYSIELAHQRDVDLSVYASVNVHEPTTTRQRGAAGREPTQVLTIKVTSIRLPHPFYFRVFASDFREVQSRLEREIRNAASIVLRQTPDEVFVDYMRSRVRANCERAGVVLPSASDMEDDGDRCVGCMGVPANVRLRHLCANAQTCSNCFCRPMWCLPCFGRWFLSRQDPAQPQSWTSGSCNCPTCNARFCLDDIIAVRRDALETM